MGKERTISVIEVHGAVACLLCFTFSLRLSTVQESGRLDSLAEHLKLGRTVQWKGRVGIYASASLSGEILRRGHLMATAWL